MSGGFAVVQPNSAMSINAVEGYPLEDFSAEAVRSQIAEAQKIANGSGSEQDVAEAKIELEVGTTKNPLPWRGATFANHQTGPGEPAARPEIECIERGRDCAVYINQFPIICEGVTAKFSMMEPPNVVFF